MIANTDITIYHRIYDPETRLDAWKRKYIKKAWWYYDDKSAVTTDGTKGSGSATIRIPDISISVARGDCIVKGNCPAEIQTIKDLKAYEYIKVLGVNCSAYGGNPHIKVVGV